MKAKGALNLFKATAVVSLTAVAFAFCACSKEQKAPISNEQKKPQILTSSYVPYTLVKNLVKDKADVSMLMPPGVEPHSFEPLPKDILKVKNAPLFFYIDKTLEPWASELGQKTAIALAKDLATYDDLHIWMDFDKTISMALLASKNIQIKYPSLKQEVNKNFEKFNTDIIELKQAYADGLKNCKNKNIYHIGHLAFGAIAKNYNLNFKPLINSSESQEPSPKDILEMIKQIKENNIKYIFTEEALSPEMATLIAEQTGAQILMLYTIEHITKEEFDAQITYQDFMSKNLANLTKGLECK